MNTIFKQLLKVTVIVMFIGCLGCSSVPREVVELSYTVGNDLTAVHVTYRQLIKDYFRNLRKQAEDFVDNEWAPEMLKRAIKKAELAKKVQKFTPEEILTYLQAWVKAAIKRIQTMRNELITPVKEDERKLLAYVNEALKEKLNTLQSMLKTDVEALRPETTDKETYDKLIVVVKEATEKNENITQIVKRLQGVAEGAVALAKKIISLPKI